MGAANSHRQFPWTGTTVLAPAAAALALHACTRLASADASCWQGGFAHMYEQCCTFEDPSCWGGEFTYDRCCLDLAPPGDATCWVGPYENVVNYHSCCEKYERWFPNPECFDAVFSFERCCGSHLAVLQFGLRKRWRVWLRSLSKLRRRPWIPLLIVSICGRIVGEFYKGPKSAKCGTQPADRLKQKAVVPAATTLRVIATCSIVGFHSLGNCGLSRDCGHDLLYVKDVVSQALFSFFVIQTDVFFVVSTYLVVTSSSLLQGDSDAADSPGSPGVRAAVADANAAILRRVGRTVPSFILAASMGVETMDKLIDMTWPGHFLGFTWPYGKPMTWPFGVELVCLVVVRLLLLLGTLLGKGAGIAAAVAVLGACLERRRRHGPLNGCKRLDSPKAWHLYHVSFVSHRLPLSLVTLLLTAVMHHMRFAACLPDRKIVRRLLECNGLMRLATAAACVMAWIFAFLGMVTSAAIEWCWNFGPRVVMPWWIYPLPAKLPLVLGCVTLMEVSRRTAAGAESSAEQAQPVMEALERHTLGVLLMHEFVEMVIMRSLPTHPRGFGMFIFELPAVLGWSFFVARILVWVEKPFREALDWCLPKIHAAARGGDQIHWSRSAVALSGSVVMVIIITAGALRTMCTEPVLDPCYL